MLRFTEMLVSSGMFGYRRLHALVSNMSPLTVWDDFDQIRALLRRQYDTITATIDTEAAKWAAATDKEVGLALKAIPDPARSFLFAHRKRQMKDVRTRQALYRLIRPMGNVLEGYVASYAVRRAFEEMEG